ncbi:hypothetical protein A9Q86_03350 [Flavobacteriales bacterium 33_180_T64]|nr:hypothetical protein A9Q86_03350 [Flavobacteriales bacterium 33_180_T64]
MRVIKYVIAFFVCLISTSFFAQESNVFLDRAFWKENPSIETIQKHINLGNDPSELNQHAFDAVSYALLEKVDNETIQFLLLKPGNGVNKITHDGRTYIFWAAYKDNLEMMEYLVNKGAKTDIIDSHGYSLLNFAAVTGQLNAKLYDFCIENGSKLSEETNHNGANSLLLLAPFIKEIKTIDYFISKGMDMRSTDNNGNGIFNYATKGGNIDLLKTLIAKDVPHKSLNKNGGNTMLFASQGTRRYQNTLAMYQFLESLGVKANVTTNNNGRNPLHAIAFENENLEVFNFFIERGVDVNQQDENGNSPFMNAANSNNLSVVNYLSTYVKNINSKTKNGHSALTMAVNRNSVDVVKFLLEKGADIKEKDAEGNTLAYYLLNTFKTNAPEVFEAKLKLLKTNGLVLNTIQSDGNTLIHLAVQKNKLALLKTLKPFHIDVNAKNNDGLSALQIAAMKSKTKAILEYLILIGADKMVKTEFDESVYDLAKENELLKLNNIDINFLK